MRKIADLPERMSPCSHPDHKPPMHIVLPPGVYEHVCPGCGNTMIFTVPEPPRMDSHSWEYDGPTPRITY